MKKAGIMTFHSALSYGAVLQSYALQQFLKLNGIENHIIDYKCDYIADRYKKLITIDKRNIPKSFVGSVLKAGNKSKSLKLFDAFRKQYMQLSTPCNTENISDISNKYSAFVAGSDQVWSPTCVGFDKRYFLDFAKDEQKFSYAASFGIKELPAEKENEYKALLSGFQGFSVREESGAKIVKSLLNKEARVNVDPTLLLKREQWDKIAVEPQIKTPYIFLFNVLKPKRLIDYAIKLGKEKNMPVYYLNDMHFPKKQGLEYLNPVSPNEFIGLIKNAEYVITNSFHANVFSLIYKRKFAMEFETCSKRNNRSEELLKKFAIEEKEITQAMSPKPDAQVNWDFVEKILEEERGKSREYILSVKEKTNL